MNNSIKFLITTFFILLLGISFVSATDVDDTVDTISSTDIETYAVYSEQTDNYDTSQFVLTNDEYSSDLISQDQTVHDNYTSEYMPDETVSSVPPSNDVIYIATNTSMEVPVGEVGKPITLTAKVNYYDMEESYPLDYGHVYFVLADNHVITKDDGDILYVPVKDGIANVTLIASDNWIVGGNRIIKARYPTFQYSSDKAYLVSESDFVELRVYDKLYETKVSMEPVSGAIGETVTFDVTVDTDDNVDIPVTGGYVTFSINDNYIITDTNNSDEPLKLDVINGKASVNITADINWLFIDHDYIRVNYTGESEYLDSISDKVSLKIYGGIDDIRPNQDIPKPAINKHSKVDKPFNKCINSKDNNHNDKTFKVLVGGNVIYDGTAITLDALNNIFNKSFINGILVVYLDGKVVFNGTTNDDLSTIIMEIIDTSIGQHKLKVEFTDSNNETNTYVETINIQ